MEFAGALIQNALAHSAGDTIAPQKLPEENAPVNVLKKCGIEFSGETDNPDDSIAWRWL